VLFYEIDSLCGDLNNAIDKDGLLIIGVLHRQKAKHTATQDEGESWVVILSITRATELRDVDSGPYWRGLSITSVNSRVGLLS
jgi:hypothetical protein